MDWLTNANTVASLVLAIFGIGGYIFGIVTYLKKKAIPTQQTTAAPPLPQATYAAQQNSVSHKPLSWMQWTAIFAQGLLTTTDFLLFLYLRKENIEEKPIIERLGVCFMLSVMVAFIIGLILVMIIATLLAALNITNITNAFNIAGVLVAILLFMTFSFIYIYHVGLLVEKKQQEQYSGIMEQQ